MEKVDSLVVGAGMFGVSIAIALRESGRDCLLVDENSDILMGASAKNQNRLHTGLHYPRDVPTAIQSARGVQRFLRDYPSSVNGYNPNHYFIGASGSKTSVGDFEALAVRIGVELTPISDKERDESGIDWALVQKGWSVDERVIDIAILRTLMQAKLSLLNIEFQGNTRITQLKLDAMRNLWHAETQDGSHFEATNIILCTYGVPIKSINLDLKYEPRLFQVTVVPVVQRIGECFGVTVMDGDFITILPRGFSDELLLYGPTPSVPFVSTSFQSAARFIQNEHELIALSRTKVLERTHSFFPDFSFQDHGESLITIRSLPASAEGSDQRRSYVKEIGLNTYQIISGKVDHAPEVADELVRRLTSHA